jgi:23S rRNA (uracil1939-C5)-methyltransferase
MARNRRNRVPAEPIVCDIKRLGHDGRGIASAAGKTQFVEGALPGEIVRASFVTQRSKFDELATIEVLQASAERVSPPCLHAGLCGGCSLQHMAPAAQIEFKQRVLAEQFAHFGGLAPVHWEPPLTGPTEGYRGKARLGVRYVAKKESVLVGFREKRSNFLADLSRCEVLDPRMGHSIQDLKSLLMGLQAYQTIPQIEVALGDSDVALVFRHMEPLSELDRTALIAFVRARDWMLFLQPGGPDSVHRVWPEQGEARLSYSIPLPPFARLASVTLHFHPLDFTQINADINRQMIARALTWLDLTEQDRVLDLFCGLGNFTLPIAACAGSAVGVEGDPTMVQRGIENARSNGLINAEFHAADLQGDFTREAWAGRGFDKILIDPPRTGAQEVCEYLPRFGAARIVYVSCNPATLARDAGILVRQGYRMERAGVMDMFPHTAHVESIALFVRNT